MKNWTKLFFLLAPTLVSYSLLSKNTMGAPTGITVQSRCHFAAEIYEATEEMDRYVFQFGDLSARMYLMKATDGSEASFQTAKEAIRTKRPVYIQRWYTRIFSISFTPGPNC